MSKTDILNAAKTLLWETGYQSMSPRKVMDASGAGQGSLYHHFRSKQDLAEAALDDIEQEMTAAAEALLGGSQAPMAKIKAYLLLERKGLKGCRLGRLANESEVIGEPGMRSRIAKYFVGVEALLARALRDAQQTDQLPQTLDVHDLACTLASVVQGGFLLSRILQDSEEISKATKGAMALVQAVQTAHTARHR